MILYCFGTSMITWSLDMQLLSEAICVRMLMILHCFGT